MATLNTNANRPWKPDRRPMVMVAPYVANFPPGAGTNTKGLAEAFVTSPPTMVNTYGKTLVDAIGGKRLLTHMFHGANQGDNYSVNYWHGMYDNGRDFYRTTVPSTYAGYSIEPYTGGYIPTSLGEDDLDDSAGRVQAIDSHIRLLANGMAPMIRLGCTKVWVDALSANEHVSTETQFEMLHDLLDSMGVPSRTIGAEAFPAYTNSTTSRIDLDTTYIEERPYLCLEWNYKAQFDYDERWSVDPSTTECHIIINCDSSVLASRAALPNYSSDMDLDSTNGPRYLDRLAAAGFIIGAASNTTWLLDWIKSRYDPTSTSNL